MEPKHWNARWIEHASAHLRFVGFADELDRSIRHNGWFAGEPHDSEVFRGVVYALTARNGKRRFVPGYADPWNDGAALLAFGCVSDDEGQAAGDADHIAEVCADREREYSTEVNARFHFDDLGDQIDDVRKATLAQLAERRQVRERADQYPAICALLRKSVKDALRSIRDMRAERETLRSDFGRTAGWQDL